MSKRSKKCTHTCDNLHCAIAHTGSSIEMIQTLINQKADVNELDQEGRSPLVHAASRNRGSKILQTLVDAKADPNLRSGGAPDTSPYVWTEMLQFATARTGFTCSQFASPLTWATVNMSAANVKVLVDAKADVNFLYVNVDQGESSTALFLAVEMGSLNIVKLLVEAKAVLDVLNQDAYTVLDVAERKGHRNILKLLLDAGAPRGVWWRMQQACIHGHADEVKLLLDAGYVLHFQDTYSRMPLKLAVQHSRTDVAQMLIAARAQVNVPRTSLLLDSVKQNNADLIRSLIAAHADVNVRDRGSCPIVYSVETGDIELTKSLIDARADVDLAPDWFDKRKTALFVAAERGDVNAARLLIDAKAHLNRLVDNRTPLASAAENGRPDMVRLLLDAKAHVDGGNGIALLCAVTKGNAEAVQILLDAKASLDIRDSHYRSPLILAISCGHAPVVSVLLAAKAALVPASIMDDPLLVASRCGNTDIMKILIDAQAPLETPLREANSLSFSPLLAAVTYQNVSAMQLLLEAKAVTDIPGTEYGYELLSCAIPDGRQSQNDNVFRLLLDTPSLASKLYNSRLLSIAYQRRNFPALQLLLERSASVDGVTVDGLPIFYKAVSDHATSAVKMMIDAKANVNVNGPQLNDTPLILASRQRYRDIVELLLDGNATLDARDRNGYTALHHSITELHSHLRQPPVDESIVQMLVDAKAPLEYNAVRAAFEGRQSAVVKMLMEAKANLRVENIRGVSLLMLALENDLPSILETLLTADPSLLDQRPNLHVW